MRPIAQAVERRTPGTVPPVIQGARVRGASALDLLQPPDGGGLFRIGPVVAGIRGGLEIAPPPPVGRVIKIPQWGAG